MIPQSSCPLRSDLERLLLGDMPEMEMEVLESHVSDCPRCLEVFRDLKTEDGLVQDMRARGRTQGIAREEVDKSLFARLCRLGQKGVTPASADLHTPDQDTGPYLENPRELSRLLAPPVEPDELGRIGSYGILRILGSGGMGIVFAARQDRPRRLVALKMILSDPRAGRPQLERFRDESEMLARLRHPNIVQVYEVGEHEGRPYFTMEHAPGGSLSKKLAGATLLPREAAELLQTLARAVHSAHEQGIVHRDLKPSNVLLAADGRPVIGDFGLAKQLQDEPGLPVAGERTETGAILGTPSYMAPEQAAGQGKAISPTADVYALGAILYECLTGRPPFKAATILETLEQVRTQEPVPPGRLQPGLPRDLQTICLKCLAKEPRRRYGSALELADDLGRFLRGEPIQARRVGAWERWWRWCRRHRLVAGLSAAVVLLVLVGVVGLAVSVVQIRQAYEKEARQRQEAQASKERAWAALTELDNLFAQVEAGNLRPEWRLGKSGRDFLVRAVEFYEGLSQGEEPDPVVRYGRARAYGRIAAIRQRLGEHDSAAQAGRRAVALLEELVADLPTEAAYQRDLAGTYQNLGDLFAGTRQLAEAEKAYGQALRHWQALAARFPAEPRYRHLLACTRFGQGLAQQDAGRGPQAEQAYGEALADQEKLLADFPTEPAYRHAVAKARNNLALLWQATGRTREAEKSFRSAVDLLECLVKEFPAEPAYRHDLAQDHHNLGLLLVGGGRSSEAEPHYRRALVLHQRLADDYPAVPDFRTDLARHHGGLGDLMASSNRAMEALAQYRQAVALQEQLAKTGGQAAWYRRELAQSVNGLGTTQAVLGQIDEAKQSFQRALGLWEELGPHYDAVPAYQVDVGDTLSNLGQLLASKGDRNEGARLVRKSIARYQAALKIEPRNEVARQRLVVHEQMLKAMEGK